MSQYERGTLNLSDFSNRRRWLKASVLVGLHWPSAACDFQSSRTRADQTVLELGENQELVLGWGIPKSSLSPMKSLPSRKRCIYQDTLRQGISKRAPRGFGEEDLSWKARSLCSGLPKCRRVPCTPFWKMTKAVWPLSAPATVIIILDYSGAREPLLRVQKSL